MSYRNKTYVIFDGDKDMYAYRFMRGWKALQHLDFDFHDAHDLNTLTDTANEATVKRKLRERFSSAKQVIVLIGENTKYLYKFVRWELDVALGLGLPIIACNLNCKRQMDPDLCPPILKGKDAVHVSFNMKILQKAMNDTSAILRNINAAEGKDWFYSPDIYKSLGL